LKEPGASERIDAIMDAQGRSKKRPQAGDPIPEEDRRLFGDTHFKR
jgi:hypothetical protein